MEQLLAQASAWLADDPDQATRDELAAVIDAAGQGDPEAVADLTDRFSGLLEFGTAGLRGRVGAGPNRMNRAVVIRAAAGLADYLMTRGVAPVSGEKYRVAVGFDARFRSDDFAVDTAAVLTAAGLEVLLMPSPSPTPMLAWATRHLPCDAGVMVTASHNPPQDNGYKVYLGGEEGGTLIVPPHDTEIAARIARVARVADVPRAERGWSLVGEDDLQRYARLAAQVAPPGPRDLRVVATPLHGVGGGPLLRILALAGFEDVRLVQAQAVPDPRFPTVAFPNPEEPGALDLALAQAQAQGADLVVANDPDADRCAVAVFDPGGVEPDDAHGRWRMLRGDELGAVLADYLAPRIAAGSQPAAAADAPASQPALACSIVSSTLLGRIAADHGLRHTRTLTGFKWIARASGLGYGYEEALGYCVAPDLVRDKDGLTAAVLACHIAAELKTEGRSMLDVLDDLARRHGLHATDQVSLRVSDLSVRDVVLARVLANPPSSVGGAAVEGVDDLSAGVPSRGGEPGIPATPGLRLRLPDGWVIVRPSGTEPKLKAYVEVVIPVDGDVGGARARAAARLADIADDLAVLLSVDDAPAVHRDEPEPHP